MTIYKMCPSLYIDAETGEEFNPIDYRYKILESEKVRRPEKCKGNVVVSEWHYICKRYGLKNEQLTFNF